MVVGESLCCYWWWWWLVSRPLAALYFVLLSLTTSPADWRAEAGRGQPGLSWTPLAPSGSTGLDWTGMIISRLSSSLLST